MGIIDMECELINLGDLLNELRTPKSINVDGVMVYTWWGIVEANTSQHCKRKVYKKLFQIVHASDLRLQSGRHDPESLIWLPDKKRVLKGCTAIKDSMQMSTITRQKFEEVCEDLWERSIILVKELLKHSGLKVDIYAFELIRGGNRVPKLQAKLQEFLGRSDVDRHLDADEATVVGASLHAANLSNGIQLNRKLGMIDGSMYDFMMDLEGPQLVKDDTTSQILTPRLKKLPIKMFQSITHNKDFDVSLSNEKEDLLPPGVISRTFAKDFVSGLADASEKSTITRQKFEEVCEDLWERSIILVKELLKHSGLKVDIYAFELIRGGNRVPKLQAKLQEFLGRSDVDRHLDADEATVVGASLHAANLSNGIQLNRKLGMIDGSMYDFMMDLEGPQLVKDDTTSQILTPRLKKLPIKMFQSITHNKDFDVSLSNEKEDLLPPGVISRTFAKDFVSGLADASENQFRDHIVDGTSKKSFHIFSTFPEGQYANVSESTSKLF
ncbi:hypothetical protein L1887_05044 [Cichorium endivia]|nr:hypothetical protein L1887_05044 [Cichorium endivia]